MEASPRFLSRRTTRARWRGGPPPPPPPNNPPGGGPASEVARLPDHHRDPFDRALVAQARFEPMRLITHDRAVAAYGDGILLV